MRRPGYASTRGGAWPGDYEAGAFGSRCPSGAPCRRPGQRYFGTSEVDHGSGIGVTGTISSAMLFPRNFRAVYTRSNSRLQTYGVDV